MRVSVLSLAATVFAGAGLATATPLQARGDQTIILPLSGDPIGTSFEFQFADESRTASSTSFVRATLKNSTFSAVIADDVPFEDAHPDRISTSLSVPPEFGKGFYDLVVEEIEGDGSVVFTGESTDLAYLVF
ncbi:hypothetical protein BD309DRAFT_407818 [Dichomitus squalens]|uniref:Uncharacterized protein n=1 Tax=Dichomitus squalens TaxID=114155 RepID=A0A4Q9NGD4_9APHY|nr:hypothetical protein BD309DRAFT_407818 [Dichomitus squalens]TBU61381.1 hypothetical protein BD310DRAFT_920651 [Dichomitus squalens]